MKEYGFVRVAAAVPEVHVGQPDENAIEIIRLTKEAVSEGVQVICFPELCLTGCTIGDLVGNRYLMNGVSQATDRIMAECGNDDIIIALDLPVEESGIIYDACIIIYKGCIIGRNIRRVPSDCRNFAQASPKGTFAVSAGNVTISVLPPDEVRMPVADIILCPAGYAEIPGRKAELQQMAMQRSSDLKAAVVIASAGHGESTTDALYAGHALIAENGIMISESHGTQGLLISDIDTELLHKSRRDSRIRSHYDTDNVLYADMAMPAFTAENLRREVSPTPFMSSEDVFSETFGIQTLGLVTRLEHTGIRKLVIGISGGLDSTLALLVCANAADRMGICRKDITGITMPGFGTTDRTYTNAVGMMKALGIDWREISIKEAALLHLRDIGHDIDVHDSAYENTQARERTQILMDVANEIGALVVGTGDLSELALGWCTYNGDHMSMYAVNASVPKTLIPGIIRHAAVRSQFAAAKANLLDVIDTPITPELLPADDKGNIVQKTEDIIGPYELHDFFLYHLVRNGFAPDKILMLARIAFCEKYDTGTIQKWLQLFLKRFFNNQFKRSCMPDGPCCGPVSLSPRGGWQMPSDMSYWKISL